MIEKEKMYVENANRAMKDGFITIDNLEPNPKNPLIASFFRNIGYADQLGSGVRNLFKYTKFYSGKEPQFIEGDIFRIIVPLGEGFSYDFGIKPQEKAMISADKMPISADKMPINADKSIEKELSDQEKIVMNYMAENGIVTASQISELLGIKQRRTRIILKSMIDKGVVEKRGKNKNTTYILIQDGLDWEHM